MPKRPKALSRALLWSLGTLCSIPLAFLFKEVTSGFIADWAAETLGAYTGISEGQVKAVIGAWLPAIATIAVAMWLAAAVTRWRIMSELAENEAARTKAAPGGAPLAILDRPVKDLSNEQLKARVHSLALRLSAAGGRASTRRDEATKPSHRIMLEYRIHRAPDPAEKASLVNELKDMDAFARDWEAADALRRSSEFKVTMAPEAVDLRRELSRRTGVPIGGIDDPARAALEDGIVDETTMRALSRSLTDMTKRLFS